MYDIGEAGYFSDRSSERKASTSSSRMTHRAQVRERLIRDYVRGGAERALAPPEFEGSERRTEGETDNPLLIAPSESKS